MPAHRRTTQQPAQHARGVRAAIDVVADMQQHRFVDRPPRQILGDDLVQVAKLCVAAMDVADGVDTPPGRHDWRAPAKFDHCRRKLQRQQRQHHPAGPRRIDEHRVDRDALAQRLPLRLAGIRVDVELREVARRHVQPDAMARAGTGSRSGTA